MKQDIYIMVQIQLNKKKKNIIHLAFVEVLLIIINHLLQHVGEHVIVCLIQMLIVDFVLYFI